MFTRRVGVLAEARDLTRPAGHESRLSRDPVDLFERHGAALYALAMLLVADRELAEALVSDAILDACTGPVHCAQGADRWELARYVYVRFRRTADPAPGTGLRAIGSGRGTADLVACTVPSDEIVATALGVFGGHTYREVAELMALPPSTVAQLMRSGLHGC